MESDLNTNAHIGNVVIYQSVREENLLGIGFVDFDSSYKPSKSQIDQQLKTEHDNMLKSSKDPEISSFYIRKIENPLRDKFRESFSKGFEKGYKNRNLTP